MEKESEGMLQDSSRWGLIRDIAVLQVKLLIDGMRDLILVPASLVAGLVSLAKHQNGQPGPQFYRLLGAGKESERLINLFGAYSNRPESMDDRDRFGDMDIDDLVSRVETYVVDGYHRGDITAQAKAKIDQALDAIQRKGTQKK
jgi:hypothetical protein